MEYVIIQAGKMKILFPTNFDDYELLDSGNGKRLERFGQYVIIRPDPQIIWKPQLNSSSWERPDAKFIKTREDQGRWEFNSKLPGKWLLKYKNISFWVKLSPFKHTGVFPEQSVHWDFIQKKISSRTTQPNILNLFGYTGIASIIAAKAGARVTHIDASYPTIGWARENQQASDPSTGGPIRWIEDDCIKFCQREVRRGVKYDGIILDPPSFGHGPNGEIWKFNDNFPKLLSICSQLISDQPLFIIVNAYAISTSAITLENCLKDYFAKFKGEFESGELALKTSSTDRLLSTGIFSRWSTD